MTLQRFLPFIEKIPILSLFLIFLTVLTQIILRYVFLYPLSWSDELARILHIWTVFMGSYIALTLNDHIRVEYFMSFIPKRWEPWLELFIHLICLIFVFFLVWSGLNALVKLSNARTAAMGMPMPYVFASTLISSILMSIYFISMLAKEFQAILSKSSKT